MQKYEDLKKIIADMETDVQKFNNGNNVAGMRVRKHLQTLRKTCMTMRNDIQQIKQSRKNEKPQESGN
ncbi:MAG: histone H1 [Bacteroidota bacterium]